MKKTFLLLLSILFCQYSYAQTPAEAGRNELDMEAFKKWIRDKRMVTIKEVGGDLSISGEARVEFQKDNEIKNGIAQRGSGSATTRPDNAFDVEVNLMFDYHQERTWAAIRIEYDNDMGVFSGSNDHLSLEKAYFGGRIVDGDTFSFDAELGRRLFSDVFESKIEFDTTYDGVVFKFNKAFEAIGVFYLNIGSFLVNDFFNHYGEVAELGFLKIGDTGFFLKYSFVNWKKNYSDPETDRRFDFGNSQIIFGYEGTTFNNFTKIYISGLINHLANNLTLADKKYPRKYNLGSYVGFSFGRILKGGDWAVNMNFQYVMPQAVADFDCSGIGRGNAQRVGLYTTHLDGTGEPTTSKTAVGNENFKGFNFELLYAITDNLTVYQNFKISNNQTFKVGPNMSFKRYEMEFIYAF
jgi:hypothetical protein